MSDQLSTLEDLDAAEHASVASVVDMKRAVDMHPCFAALTQPEADTLQANLPSAFMLSATEYHPTPGLVKIGTGILRGCHHHVYVHAAVAPSEPDEDDSPFNSHPSPYERCEVLSNGEYVPAVCVHQMLTQPRMRVCVDGKQFTVPESLVRKERKKKKRQKTAAPLDEDDSPAATLAKFSRLDQSTLRASCIALGLSSSGDQATLARRLADAV